MKPHTIRVVTDIKEFESLAEVWNSLLQKCGDESTIFLTHEWLFTWWQHFGENNMLNILLVENEGEVTGIIPLMEVEYKLAFIKLRILKNIGAINSTCVGVIPPENRQEVIAALLHYLKNALTRNLALKLELIPGDSQSLDILQRQATLFSGDFSVQNKPWHLAPYIPLTETWDEYFGSVSRKRRAVLRQALRLLENSHMIEFREYRADSLEDGLSEFFDLHQRRWQSVAIKSFFSDSRWREFYRDLSRQLLNKGWLRFTCLRVDGKLASAVYGLVYNHKFYAAISARNTDYTKYSVGHLHYMYLIKDAIKQHLREFDFLRGAQPYKFYWARRARKYVAVTVTKRGLLSTLCLKCLNTFLFLHWIRQDGLRMVYRSHMEKKRWEKENERLGLPICNS